MQGDESRPSTGSSRRQRETASPEQIAKKIRYSPSTSFQYHGPSNGQTAVSGPLKPLSLSILGVEPLDEFIREIADWVYQMIISRPMLPGAQVEVEAKLGCLKYKDANQRLQHPVRVETILFGDDHRFESNMSAAQHKHFNTLLNSLEESSHHPAHLSSPIRHVHMHLIDNFYNNEDSREKIRVTRDEKTGEIKECLKKIRLGSLDVFSPKRQVDWRVSVNLEVPVPHPVGTASLSRRKDRMSYSHEEFVIELTQVTQAGQGQTQLMHELEIEFARPALLLSTAAVRGDPEAQPLERDAFDELIRVFVNNVRVLVRNARPP